MTTTFALLCDRCGLSSREAAEFLEVRPDTIKSWSSGRRDAPPGTVDRLRALYAKIERAADALSALVAEQINASKPPTMIEFGLATDAEARSLGWPCVGAQSAALGIAAARAIVPIVIVPRGTTLATAAAADHHDQAWRNP